MVHMVPSNDPSKDHEEERRESERRTINRAGLIEMIHAHDQKHDAAHKRLRDDYRELEERCADGQRLLVDKINAHNTRITELSITPVDVTKLVATPRIIASIVGSALLIAGAMWASNGGLRSDVRDILTRMANEQRVSDANAKLLEVNNATIKTALADNTREMKEAISAVTKKQELLGLQYNELSGQVTRLIARGEK